MKKIPFEVLEIIGLYITTKDDIKHFSTVFPQLQWENIRKKQFKKELCSIKNQLRNNCKVAHSCSLPSPTDVIDITKHEIHEKSYDLNIEKHTSIQFDRREIMYIPFGRHIVITKLQLIDAEPDIIEISSCNFFGDPNLNFTYSNLTLTTHNNDIYSSNNNFTDNVNGIFPLPIENNLHILVKGVTSENKCPKLSISFFLTDFIQPIYSNVLMGYLDHNLDLYLHNCININVYDDHRISNNAERKALYVSAPDNTLKNIQNLKLVIKSYNNPLMKNVIFESNSITSLLNYEIGKEIKKMDSQYPLCVLKIIESINCEKSLIIPFMIPEGLKFENDDERLVLQLELKKKEQICYEYGFIYAEQIVNRVGLRRELGLHMQDDGNVAYFSI